MDHRTTCSGARAVDDEECAAINRRHRVRTTTNESTSTLGAHVANRDVCLTSICGRPLPTLGAGQLAEWNTGFVRSMNVISVVLAWP
jgi:hypothetical protein